MGDGKFGSILLGLVARGVKRVIACTPATKASAGCHRVSCMVCMSRSSTVNAAQGARCSGSTGHDYSEQIWSALNHWIESLWGIGYDATKVFLMRRARLPDEILIVYLVYCGLWRVVFDLVGCPQLAGQPRIVPFPYSSNLEHLSSIYNVERHRSIFYSLT